LALPLILATECSSSAQGDTPATAASGGIGKDDNGAWDMALTVSVREKFGDPSGHWSVVLHAHPAGPANPVPTPQQLLYGNPGFLRATFAQVIAVRIDQGGTVFRVVSRVRSATRLEMPIPSAASSRDPARPANSRTAALTWPSSREVRRW
jgi:hypothetical protein